MANGEKPDQMLHSVSAAAATHFESQLTHGRLNELNSPPYILEESNFNFRYVGLCDLDIPGEKWLTYLQTVDTLIRCHILRHLIWSACLPVTLLGVS